MGRKMIVLICLAAICLLLVSCSLQEDTFEILHSIPLSTEEAPQIPPTTDAPGKQPTQPPNHEEAMVWVPSGGGSKYHKSGTCSNMINPKQIAMADAVEEGYSPCKKCYKESD